MSIKVQKSSLKQLEDKEVLRGCVVKASVQSIGKQHVLLKTEAVTKFHKAISSADTSMADMKSKSREGETVEGRIRLDVVRDDILRIRYAEGKSIPANKTEMVCGKPGPAEKCQIRKAKAKAEVGMGSAAGEKQDVVTLCTKSLRVTVFLDPYRVIVEDQKGQKIAGFSGPEKNFFSCFDSYNTGIHRTVQGQDVIATENFDLAPGEAVYGFGEKFNGLNKRGQTLELNMKDALGVLSPRSYKNIPFFMTTQGYGVFFNHSSIMNFWVGSMASTDIQMSANDDFLDYYVFTGSLTDILSSYTDLTGKGQMPPPWTFGYWQSKISYQSAEETLDIARKMRKHQVPCDVIHLDTHWFRKDWLCDLEFDPERFPDPKAYLKELADLGFNVSLWQIPYIPEGSELFNELLEVDGFVKDQDGGIHPDGFCFTKGFEGRVGIIDFSNPKGVKIYQKYLKRLFRLGAKVIKTDFGEAAPVDGVYHDGRPGRQHHNLYPLLYNDAVAKATKEGTGDAVVWARSAWAGSQRYPLHWGGDNSPNYYNLLPQLEGGLSFGMSGFQFWSQDIGGFMGTTDDPLLIRWMQLGMFLSHSRIHGFGDRELYKFKKKTLSICRDYIQLRYRLMPYILSQSEDCVKRSLPLARPLVLEFPDDPNVYNISDQYLFGSDLMVAPILDDGTRRRVYLPEGHWTDWWTREVFEGGQWLDVEAPLDRMPLYIREGAMIPLGPVMNYVGERALDEVELIVSAPSKDSSRILKISDGTTSHSIKLTVQKGKAKLQLPSKSGVTWTVRECGPKSVKVSKGNRKKTS